MSLSIISLPADNFERMKIHRRKKHDQTHDQKENRNFG